MMKQPSEETRKLVSGLDEFPDWDYLFEQYEHELGYDIGHKRVDDMRRAKHEIYQWKQQEQKHNEQNTKTFPPQKSLESKLMHLMPRLAEYKIEKISENLGGKSLTPDSVMNVIAETLEGEELWHAFNLLQSKHV